jgi:signal transduction histidine kinase
MGLAFVKALVRRHGGEIWCRSTLGEGSTFSFSLPGA